MSAGDTNNTVFIQRLFSSRDNFVDGNTQEATSNTANFVGQEGRIWWDPTRNNFYASDGNTPGGILIGGGSGNGTVYGSNTWVQYNNNGNFGGTTAFTFNSDTNVLSATYFSGDGSNLTNVNLTGAASGNTTEIQFNDDGNFDASANLTFNKGTGLLTVVGNITANTVTANSLVGATAGNLTVTGNLLPLNNTYSLGLVTDPWQDAFFGPQSITILDDTGNIANSVIIQNLAANIVIGTTGFTINEFGTSNAIFRIEALTGRVFSNALTIIANDTNSSNTESGSLQTAGGAGIAKDLYVGGNIYGEGKQLSNVVTYVTAGVGLTGGGTGNIGIDATGVQSITGTANRVIVTDLGGQNFNLSTPQDLNTSSTLTFANLTITGTLTVSNLVSTGNSVIDSKILNLAANSTSAAQIDQGGIILGNANANYAVSILYDLANNQWNTDGAGLYTLDFVAANADIDDLHVRNRGHFGTIDVDEHYPNAFLQVDSNVNSYSQIVGQNHNPGTAASSDLVLINDIGDDSNHYINMGINGSNYVDPAFSSTLANDGYLFVNQGNLVIGTDTPGQVVNFVAGGTTSDDIIVTISNTGISTPGNVTANFFIGNGSQLTGIAAGNITGTIANANYAAYAGNVTIAGQSNITSLGTLTSLTVSGNANVGNLGTGRVIATGNISGTQLISNVATGTAPLVVTSTTVVANLRAATANTAGTVTTAAQPNITSVGTLTSLTVSGTSNLGPAGNITITGGSANYVLQTNGSGGLSWVANPGIGAITTITPNALSSSVHIAATVSGNTANIITDATTANTANTIVVRDASGAINVNGWTVGTHLTAVNYTATNSDYWIGTSAKSKTITLPNAANGASTGRQYQIADVVHNGNPGTTIAAQSPATVVGNQPSQQGQIIIATYVGGVWYLN